MADENTTNISGFGLQKSKLNAQGTTTIPSTATFDFVSNGQNIKVTMANLITNLGATGTIVQEGAVTGTSVLDVQGTVNNIRNLENGSGIKASVSAENGITLDHNFIADTAGAELVVDLTVTQPKFRSLIAGSGMSVAESNGTIQIALSGAPTSNKTVIINSESDFPTAVAGVITLQDNTEYAILNDISTSNRFVLGDNCVLTGSDNIVVSLTYTGAGVMFTSLNKSWTLNSLTMTCASGTFVDFDGTGAEIFQIRISRIIADTMGTINDVSGIHFDDTQMDVTTQGFIFGGTNGVILLEANLSTVTAGTLYDLGTATFNAFSVTDSFVNLLGSSVFLDGAASSANITSGNLGSVHNCRFFNTGTPIQTITSNDVRWEFHINNKVDDTHKDCLMSQIGNATPTVIATVSTPVLLAGTWTEEHESQFTTTAAGRMTYDGEYETHFDITMSFSGAPVSGSNKTIAYYAALNGSVISNSEALVIVSAGSFARVTVIWRIALTTGDYIESFVENETDGINILVTDAVMRIS